MYGDCKEPRRVLHILIVRLALMVRVLGSAVGPKSLRNPAHLSKSVPILTVCSTIDRVPRLPETTPRNRITPRKSFRADKPAAIIKVERTDLFHLGSSPTLR